MPLIYAFVARGPTVLAEHTSHSGNFATVAAEVRRPTDASFGRRCIFVFLPSTSASRSEGRRADSPGW